MSAVLDLVDVEAFYGSACALQNVSLTLAGGACAVVGRNGMGKTTLCRAIMGLIPMAGEVRFAGESLADWPSYRIAQAGIGYVPQGRRVFASLTVDEHLRIMARRRSGWTAERVYQLFPRLAERKRNRGSELSGGEQQMLAIGRALTTNPKLLVMDEPTEGLAPIIVEHVVQSLRTLAAEGLAILIVEQDIAVATEVGERILIMVNGRIAADVSPRDLLTDVVLRHRYLGIEPEMESER